MEDFWSHSQTTTSALDTFFDEESNVSWTGESLDSKSGNSYGTSALAVTPEAPIESSLSSIMDSIDSHPDDASENPQVKSVGKSFGETFGALKHPTRKWAKIGLNNSNKNQTDAKDAEINDLKLRLERSFSRHNITLPPEDVINRMILGKPCCLEAYKILKDKLALLEFALDSKDSDAILNVVLFLKRTVKKSLFIEELKKKPQAVQVFINYLRKRDDNIEALDYLRAFGRKEEAALLKYQMALAGADEEVKIKNLKSSMKGNSFDSAVVYEFKMMKQHLDLLEYQIKLDKEDIADSRNPTLKEYPRASNVAGQSLLNTLFYCCMYHWQEPETYHSSPWFLKKTFTVSDKQFLWAFLQARSRVKHWPLPSEMDKTLSSPSLLSSLANLGRIGVRRTVKDILPIEEVISFLHLAGAPTTVLAAYIDLLLTAELKLKLGTKTGCHQAVIEAYISMRDKTALENYLTKVPVGSSEYVRAENALKKLL